MISHRYILAAMTAKGTRDRTSKKCVQLRGSIVRGAHGSGALQQQTIQADSLVLLKRSMCIVICIFTKQR